MPFLVLLMMLVASVAHAQDPFEPNAAEVIGGQLGELGASVGDYVRLTAMRKARVEAAERAVKDCIAKSCGNRAALEKELTEARAVDAIVRSAEGALLASLGVPGVADFGDLIRKTITAINEEESRKRQEMAIVSSVEGPVKNWCFAGFKANEVVEVQRSNGPDPVGCVWDVLQGWATPLGMKVSASDGRSKRNLGDLYYILSTRELMARSLCEKQVALDRDKVPVRVQEKLDTCAAQYSEVARLKQMYEQRMVVQRARNQQEVEAAIAATARRTQDCQGISELQAQIAAKSRELGDARTKASQAEREYRRQLATQRLPPQEARTQLERKRADLQAEFGVDAIAAQRVELEKKLLEVQKACVAAR
jgi:hypothetical protein